MDIILWSLQTPKDSNSVCINEYGIQQMPITAHRYATKCMCVKGFYFAFNNKYRTKIPNSKIFQEKLLFGVYVATGGAHSRAYII